MCVCKFKGDVRRQHLAGYDNTRNSKCNTRETQQQHIPGRRRCRRLLEQFCRVVTVSRPPFTGKEALHFKRQLLVDPHSVLIKYGHCGIGCCHLSGEVYLTFVVRRVKQPFETNKSTFHECSMLRTCALPRHYSDQSRPCHHDLSGLWTFKASAGGENGTSSS